MYLKIEKGFPIPSTAKALLKSMVWIAQQEK